MATKHLPSFFCLTAVFWLAVAAVNPLGDFPLNDDFSYGRSVYNLSERGIFLFDDWLGMPLLTQVLWGALFTKVFGFSFTVLRFFTLVSAWLGGWLVYLTLHDLEVPPRTALFSALLVVFNPLFFSLSFTFMTDVPFFAFAAAGIFCYHRYLRMRRGGYLAAAMLLTVAATLIRQIGFMLPLAFIPAYLLANPKRVRHVIAALLPLAVTTAAYLLFKGWFAANQGLPDNFDGIGRLTRRIDADFPAACLMRIGQLINHLGFYLLPLLLAASSWRAFVERLRSFSRWRLVGIGSVSLLLFLALWQANANVFGGNILYQVGLGPPLLKDGAYFINLPNRGAALGYFFRALFFLGGLLLILQLVPALFRGFRFTAARRPVFIFAVSAILLYGGFLLLELFFFDRYFIQLLLFLPVIYCMVVDCREIRITVPAIVAALALAAFSITCTHDYLAWQRAKTAGIEYLRTELDVPVSHIDGGFAFNGWHRRPDQPRFAAGKSDWWIDRDDYAVTFGPVGGYEKIGVIPYLRWFPPRQDSIWVQLRVE